MRGTVLNRSYNLLFLQPLTEGKVYCEYVHLIYFYYWGVETTPNGALSAYYWRIWGAPYGLSGIEPGLHARQVS